MSAAGSAAARAGRWGPHAVRGAAGATARARAGPGAAEGSGAEPGRPRQSLRVALATQNRARDPRRAPGPGRDPSAAHAGLCGSAPPAPRRRRPRSAPSWRRNGRAPPGAERRCGHAWVGDRDGSVCRLPRVPSAPGRYCHALTPSRTVPPRVLRAELRFGSAPAWHAVGLCLGPATGSAHPWPRPAPPQHSAGCPAPARLRCPRAGGCAPWHRCAGGRALCSPPAPIAGGSVPALPAAPVGGSSRTLTAAPARRCGSPCRPPAPRAALPAGSPAPGSPPPRAAASPALWAPRPQPALAHGA